MARFLTILHGTDADVDRVDPNAQQQREFMNAWAAWAHDHGEALVDPGSPLFRKKRLTAEGDEELRLEDYEASTRLDCQTSTRPPDLDRSLPVELSSGGPVAVGLARHAPRRRPSLLA